MRYIILPLFTIIYFAWSYVSIKDIKEALELSYHYSNRSLFFSSYISWSTIAYIAVTILLVLITLAHLLIIYW